MTLAAMIPSQVGPWAQSLARYELEGHLGSGGMGSVYKAFDTVLQRIVALKVPLPELVFSSRICDQFLREARTAAQLNHPNICRIFDYGRAGETPYLTMEYVAGSLLSEQHANGRPRWGPWAVADLVKTLAHAMAAAHAQGFIHRDLKPHNIQIRPAPGYEPVIIDFGLALRLDSKATASSGDSDPEGTFAYMSPEQLTGDGPPGPHTDIYSLGVVFYELLTGELPFKSTSRSILIAEILNDDPEPPDNRKAAIPALLLDICRIAMHRDAKQRFRSMIELADALGTASSGSSRVESRRRWWKAWTVRTRGSLARPPQLSTKGTVSGTTRVRTRGSISRPRQANPERIDFKFIVCDEIAPADLSAQNRLYLDVGKGLRTGVIDRHHSIEYSGSTTSLVRNRPDLIQATVEPTRFSAEPYTIILHEFPDLDSAACAFLAIALLTSGNFPEGYDMLAHYADGVDEESIGMSPSQPYSLFPAFRQLVARCGSGSPGWSKLMAQALTLVEYALKEAVRTEQSLLEVDAFACPGLFSVEERSAIRDDRDRYLSKLADPGTAARVARLSLPSRFGGTVELEGLLVRDVENENDPGRCQHFKDWARLDDERCPNRRGFEVVCVFATESGPRPRSCTISVTPLSLSSLNGLGELLEAAELSRRIELYGVDERVNANVTAVATPREQGLDPRDRWHDGHSHHCTVVKSPRSGTVLSAQEVEAILLRFGYGEQSARPLA
jgi:serine/threonine protein kinase